MKFISILVICLLFYIIDVSASSFLKFKASAKIKTTIKKDCDDDDGRKPEKPVQDSCDDDDDKSPKNDDDCEDNKKLDDESCEDDKQPKDDCDDDDKKPVYTKPKDDYENDKKPKHLSKIKKAKDNIWYLKGKGKCTFILPAVAPAPRDIAQVVKYLKSQVYDESLLCNVAWSEVEIAKKTAEMSKGYECEDAKLPITKLIKKHGFQPEEHTVETEDGYILTIHRVCGDRDGEPVILMNPLLGSTDDFITPGVQCLAYDLSRAGYDVYLGNARGNKYSRKHKRISPKCEEFWDFSWDEVGRYDLPAIIDYILKLTGRKKLHYIGWSQGTTSFFVMCSERPEYNDKIACMHALSPVVYMQHAKSPLVRLMGLNTDMMYTVSNLVGSHEINPKTNFISLAAKVICAPNPISTMVCSNFMMIITGFDIGQTNFTNLPINMGHSPAGASMKQCIHYGQEITSGKFRNFDYGKTKNREVYGCDEPPEYPLEKVTAPVALYYGTEDWLCNVVDAKRLAGVLPNVVDNCCIDKYNHMDYIWGSNAREKVNKRILKLMSQYPLDDDSNDSMIECDD